MNKLISFILMALIMGCSAGKREDSVSDLKDNVMDIHDEVMPKFGELRKLERSLRQKAEGTMDSVLAEKMIMAADEVKLANDNMMEWMRNYDPNFEGTEGEVRDYLEDQKEKITTVRDNMLESLKSGNDLLNNN